MTIIEAVKTFVQQYPLLANSRLNVDFLPEDAQSYSIETVPGKEIVKKYIDGTSLRQFSFIVASREYFGEDIRQQIDNLGFYEDLGNWFEQCTREGNLPDLGIGRTSQSIEVTTSGYVFIPNENVARYQIQCQLKYIKE